MNGLHGSITFELQEVSPKRIVLLKFMADVANDNRWPVFVTESWAIYYFFQLWTFMNKHFLFTLLVIVNYGAGGLRSIFLKVSVDKVSF